MQSARYISVVQPSYETFDHTADVGLLIRAASLPELIQPAMEGFYAMIGELVACGDATSSEICLRGDDSAILLRDFLQELLVLFDRDEQMVTSIEVSCFDDSKLQVAIQINAVDMNRSAFYREVKAITYHELDISPIDNGWEATIILDI